MEYHETHNVYHVKQFLGHRSIKSTEVYINVEQAIFQEGNDDEFHVKVAKEPNGIQALSKVGFKYICEKDGLLFFRKRK